MAHVDQTITATQMVWQPPLVKLTAAPHQDIDGGKPQSCYVNPQLIAVIQRMAIQHHKFKEGNKKKWPPVNVTAVQTGALIMYVKETPDQVAKLRDEALGHKLASTTKLKAV